MERIRKKEKILLFLLIALFIFTLPAIAQDDERYSSLNEDEYASVESEDEYISIAGRSYKIAPGFEMPEWVNEDVPVQLVFDDETHTLIAIERMKEDESDGIEMEYHFGVVNAVSRASSQLEYRVYVNGIGYLFDSTTRLDEAIAPLNKFATVALVTYQGRAISCKVLAANIPVDESNIFYGPVEQVKETDDGAVITINGVKHNITPNTEITGLVSEEGTWVFGYDVGKAVKFVSVIEAEFPSASEASSYSGFVTYIGTPQQNGSYYVSVDNSAYQITPTTAINTALKVGDYVVGVALGNTALTAANIQISYDTSAYRVFYQVIDDITEIKDDNSPTGSTIVAISLGDAMVDIDSETRIYGNLAKDLPVMVVTRNNRPVVIYIEQDIKQGRKPVYGMVSWYKKTAEGYDLLINGAKYRTSYSTKMEFKTPMKAGVAIAGITDGVGNLDLLVTFESVLPVPEQYYFIGRINQVGVNGIDVDGRIITLDETSVVSGTVDVGKYAAVAIGPDDFGELVYVFPSSHEDIDYHIDSGVLNGIHEANSRGNRTVRLDDKVFLINPDSVVTQNLAYDEIGTALYTGENTVAILDVLQAPGNTGKQFAGKIEKAVVDKESATAAFMIDGVQYNVYPSTSFVKFHDITRIYKGAKVKGFVLDNNDVIALQMVRCAGLFGILNPPWLEYVLVVLLALAIFITVMKTAKDNRSYWRTGYIDIGARDTIILRDEYEEAHQYEISPDLFEFLMNFKDQEVTVKIHKGEIIEVR